LQIPGLRCRPRADHSSRHQGPRAASKEHRPAIDLHRDRGIEPGGNQQRQQLRGAASGPRQAGATPGAAMDACYIVGEPISVRAARPAAPPRRRPATATIGLLHDATRGARRGPWGAGLVEPHLTTAAAGRWRTQAQGGLVARRRLGGQACAVRAGRPLAAGRGPSTERLGRGPARRRPNASLFTPRQIVQLQARRRRAHAPRRGPRADRAAPDNFDLGAFQAQLAVLDALRSGYSPSVLVLDAIHNVDVGAAPSRPRRLG